MGSVNSSGVSVVPKQNASTYNIGRRQVTASGVPFARYESSVGDTPLFARDSSGLGTQPSGDINQRSALMLGHKQKIAQSNNDGIHGRVGARYVPTSGIENEIYLKPVSQYFSTNSGKRIITRDSDTDGLVSRENS